MFVNRPNRLRGVDYSRDNFYFITTVVKNRISCLGEINNGTLELNTHGIIVQNQLRWLESQYSYVKLHEHIVMPDHVHAIIEINRNCVGVGRDCVGVGRDLHLHNQKIKSLSELIGAFKSTSSKQIRLNGFQEFQWQTSFHDRIIRNLHELNCIAEYILKNPVAWCK